jgi:uncharacterized protein YndB with AHSA1/START domain/DNA-binding transcriptional ArsR family regulator
VTDDDRAFKALADPTRRFLLDRLFARDGRTLTELESELEMTRFGVMKHLRVLEEAGLLVVRRSGREKLHYLNPVPIRQIHDRWIDKYTERRVTALLDLKTDLEMGDMTSTTESDLAVQVYQLFIKASPEAIWDAITDPEWNRRYGYMSPGEYDLRPGGAYRAHASPEMKAHGAPDIVIDGEVLEAERPRRLVQTWRAFFEPSMAEEGFTRLTWEIEEGPGGISRLTVTHDLRTAPRTAALVGGRLPGAGGGWSLHLSDLKTLLETGTSLLGGGGR